MLKSTLQIVTACALISCTIPGLALYKPVNVGISSSSGESQAQVMKKYQAANDKYQKCYNTYKNKCYHTYTHGKSYHYSQNVTAKLEACWNKVAPYCQNKYMKGVQTPISMMQGPGPVVIQKNNTSTKALNLK